MRFGHFAPAGPPAFATTATGPPTTTAPTAAPTVPPSSAARREVESLQTVPAIRDLVVEINGRRYATGADGTVAVLPEDRHGAVTVVGIRAEPALLQATFTGWADGSTAPTRSPTSSC